MRLTHSSRRRRRPPPVERDLQSRQQFGYRLAAGVLASVAAVRSACGSAGDGAGSAGLGLRMRRRRRRSAAKVGGAGGRPGIDGVRRRSGGRGGVGSRRGCVGELGWRLGCRRIRRAAIAVTVRTGRRRRRARAAGSALRAGGGDSAAVRRRAANSRHRRRRRQPVACRGSARPGIALRPRRGAGCHSGACGVRRAVARGSGGGRLRRRRRWWQVGARLLRSAAGGESGRAGTGAAAARWCRAAAGPAATAGCGGAVARAGSHPSCSASDGLRCAPPNLGAGAHSDSGGWGSSGTSMIGLSSVFGSVSSRSSASIRLAITLPVVAASRAQSP